MQISGVPNKFEIFQDFYYDVNGIEITYAEALRLFSQMDEDTRSDFEQYYIDETGYEIITGSGFNLSSDGTFSAVVQNEINTKYTIDAYAKKNGLVLDPQWSIYSAEEIIQMADNGVNIPQDIIDIAYTIFQTSPSNDEQTVEGEDGTESTTEKEPFLELIPKAEKKIKKCNEINEKINDEIEELLPEQRRSQRKLNDRMEEQRKSLKEFESHIREWNTIQTKINNGEALSDTEARRYAILTGMFEDKDSRQDNFSIDKNAIASSMNDINILAVLGEKLADETIVIGNTLADYTSEANYKTTRKQVSGEIGFLATITAMIKGGNLAKESQKIGNDTKEYTEESQKSVTDIAQVLDIEDQIAGKADILETAKPEQTGSEEAVDETDIDSAKTKLEIDNPEVTQQEDFVINDDTVKELIDEAQDINSDLSKQTISAARSIRVARGDQAIAKIAGVKVTKLVKKFKEEEAKRQEEITRLQEENKQADEELKELTGKTSQELDEENGDENPETGDEANDEKIKELRTKVKINNSKIETLQTSAVEQKTDFVEDTAKIKSFVDKSIPKESEALQKDSEYLENTLPEHADRLDFADNSGQTLSKIGKFRVELGFEQLAQMQWVKGAMNIAKGLISTGIGLKAQVVSDTHLPEITDKVTTKATTEENNAITSLTQIDGQITEITGAQQAQNATEDSENTTEENATANSEENTPAVMLGAPAQTAVKAPAETPAETSGETPVATASTKSVATTSSAQTASVEPIATEPTTADTTNPEDVVVTPETAGEMVADEVPAQAQTLAVNAGTEATESNKNPNEEGTPVGQVQNKPTTTTSSAKKDDEEMDTDQAGSSVASITGSAKDDSKDSEKVLKDTEKDEKQLERETKQLQKQMKKDEKEVVKMTKESMKSAQKQAIILAEYETLIAENETLIAQEEAKSQGLMVDGQFGKSNDTQTSSNMQISGPVESENTAKLEMNDGRITQLGIEFTMHGKKIDINSAKIKRIQKRTKTNRKKFDKKTEIRMDKIKEAEKKEQAKQKRLAKQLGAVGIAENIFSITMSTGAIMQLYPPTAAAGKILFHIGLYGVLACGIAKATINVANGNWTAALIGLGTTAVTAALSFTGVGASAGTVLNAVSSGLSVVSNSAQLVNNVRAVQGKEANGTFGMIGTIAGAASALTNVAGSFGQGFAQAGNLAKVATVASAVGTVLSQTSSLMNEFGASGKTANLLGMIGGAISTAGALTQLTTSFSKLSTQDKPNQEKADNVETNSENNGENTPKAEETKSSDNNKNPDNSGNNKGEAKKKADETKQDIERENRETAQQLAAAGVPNPEAVVAQGSPEAAVDAAIKSVESSSATTGEQFQAAQTDAQAQQSQIDEILAQDNPANQQIAQNKVVKLEEIPQGKIEGIDVSGVPTPENIKLEKINIPTKESFMDKVNNFSKKMEPWMDVAGQAMSTGMQIAQLFAEDDTQQERKKVAPQGRLTQRTRDIMRKNRRRIQALRRRYA